MRIKKKLFGGFVCKSEVLFVLEDHDNSLRSHERIKVIVLELRHLLFNLLSLIKLAHSQSGSAILKEIEQSSISKQELYYWAND